MGHQRLMNWVYCLVAASCMILYGYDASVYNAVQGSKNWVAYNNKPVCLHCSNKGLQIRLAFARIRPWVLTPSRTLK